MGVLIYDICYVYRFDCYSEFLPCRSTDTARSIANGIPVAWGLGRNSSLRLGYLFCWKILRIRRIVGVKIRENSRQNRKRGTRRGRLHRFHSSCHCFYSRGEGISRIFIMDVTR